MVPLLLVATSAGEYRIIDSFDLRGLFDPGAGGRRAACHSPTGGATLRFGAPGLRGPPPCRSGGGSSASRGMRAAAAPSTPPEMLNAHWWARGRGPGRRRGDTGLHKRGPNFPLPEVCYGESP